MLFIANQTISCMTSPSGIFLPGLPAPAPLSTAQVLSLMHLVNCAKHKGKNSILTTAGNHLMP